MTVLVSCPIEEYVRPFDSIGEANKFYAEIANHPSRELEKGHLFKEFHLCTMQEIDNGSLNLMQERAKEYLELGVPSVTISAEYEVSEDLRKIKTGHYTLKANVLVPEYSYSRDFESDLKAEKALRREIISHK